MRTLSVSLALLLVTTPALACTPWSIERREQYGMNLSAVDLLDTATSTCRLTTYLNEIESEGFAKRVRIIFPPDWGPQVLRDWIPIIRAKGFRVIAILSQGSGDAELEAQQAWAQYALPQIADILDAVQPQNESNDTTGWSPERYANWHQAMVPVIRTAVPGVPILSPTLNNGAHWVSWHHGTGLVPGQDYDLLAANVSNWSKKLLKKLAKIAKEENLPVWLTEARWDEVLTLREMGVRVERTYVFVWNEWEGGNMAVRPGGTVPPVCPAYQEGFPR